MAKEISMSKSQSNGITGEMLLPLHLKEKFNCIANKLGIDFGFDFDVHVFDKSGTTKNIFFKAQCKEVESGEYKYAKLEEKHINLYLKTREIVCIFGVDLEKCCIRHRFFDKKLAQKFLDALKKGQSQICLNFETELRPESEFLKDLDKFSDQCVQNQLYEFISEKKFQEIIPNAQIKMLSDSQGTNLKITTPYITDVLNPFFVGKSGKVDDAISSECLCLINERYRHYNSICFGGIVSNSISTISTSTNSIKVSVWPRQQRTAFMMDSGLSFEFGPCQNGSHPMYICVEKSAKPFFECSGDVTFFEEINSNDSLFVENSAIVSHISEWENLDFVIRDIKKVLFLKKELPELFGDFFLSNLKDETYWNNLQVLYMLLKHKNKKYILEEFILNVEDQKYSYHEEIQGVVPIIFTLKNVYRLTFSCCYCPIECNGAVVGVVIGKLTKVESEILQNEGKMLSPAVDFSGVKPSIPWNNGQINCPPPPLKNRSV